jgi:exosortase
MKKLPSGLNFVVLCAVSLLLWMRPLFDTFSLAVNDNRYTQILLILPVTAVLIIQGWLERGGKPQIWTPAAGLLIAALALACAARWGHFVESSDVRLAIEMLALVGWWIASFAFCFGLAALRACCFPLCFLVWIVPIPAFILDRVVAGLQQGSTVAAQWLFLLFRVPVARDGITLSIPGLDIDVTPECSSIRSSLMLLVTTMVLAFLLLKQPWRKALVIALAIPLSVAKNGLRIFTIGMLGSRVDPSYLTGRLHRHGGIVFFLIALAGIFLVLWILRRGDGGQTPAPSLSSQKA